MVLRWIKWFSLALSLILAAVIVTVSIGLGSEFGRHWLVQSLVNQLNKTGALQIDIEGLETHALGQWQAKKIRLYQGHQLWISAEHFKLVWQPSALFGRAVVINQIQTKAIELYKLPSDIESKKNGTAQAKVDKNISKALTSLPGLQLDVLNVNTFSLHGFQTSTATDGPLSYTLTGEVRWLKNTPLKLKLSAKGQSSIPANLNLEIQSQDSNSAILSGNLQEATGGRFSKLLKLPKTQEIDASFMIAATKKQDRYHIEIQRLNFPLAKHTVMARGQLSLAPENWAINIDDLTLNINDTEHKITGSLAGQQLEAQLELNKFPVDIIHLWHPILSGGEFSTQLKVSGTTNAPYVEGNISGNTAYQQLPIHIDFLGSIDKQRVVITKLAANLNKAEVAAKGTIDLTDSIINDSAMNISVKNFEITTLKALGMELPENLNATLNFVEASLHGTIEEFPYRLQGQLKAEITGNYESEKFLAEASLNKATETQLITTTKIITNKGNISLTGDLNPRSLDTNAIIKAQSMSLNLLKLAGINLPEALHVELDTQLALNGNLSQPISSLSMVGNAQLYGDYQNIPFFLDAKGNFLNSNTFLETLTLTAFDEEVLRVNGYYKPGHTQTNKMKTDSVELNVQAKKLPSKLLEMAGWHLQPGNFYATVQARGSMQNPELNGALNYQTQLSGYDSDGEQQEIQFIWDLNLSTSDDRFTLASVFTRNNQPPGQLTLHLPKQPYIDYGMRHYGQTSSKMTKAGAFPLEAKIEGKLNLQTVSFLLDPDLHRLTGQLETGLSLSGTSKKPTVKGHFQVTSSRYENPITGSLIDAINCQLTAQQITFQIGICQATDGDNGHYSLAGKVLLPANGSAGVIDLNLQSQGANILRRPDIESEATGDIALTGDFSLVLASGNLELAPLTILLDSVSSRDIPSIRVEEVDSKNQGDTLDKQKFAVPKLNFNLNLAAGNRAYLRGRGLEAELQGQIAIKGDLDKPLYDGKVKTVRGVFEVFNKKFVLREGIIDFSNNATGLAITGVFEKNGQRIQANLTGTDDDIRLNFTANPAMPEDEILAFIIFGKSIQKMTPFEALQLASAVQKLSSGSSFDPIGSTRKMLGLDTLSVESITNENGESGINFGVGKYLNERVYLELERTPNPSQPWKGNIEIELAPNLNLESSTGGRTGIEGAELKWKKDY